AIHIFTDGTIIFLENGIVQPPGRAPVAGHMRGKVGFGPSPNCAFDHVMAEFQIPLTAAGGGSYSDDPLFWNSDPPPPKCPKGTINVPVKVNVLKNVLTDDGAIQDMVSGANRILSPAGMCVELSSVNIQHNAPDPNNDGHIDRDEWDAINRACAEELGAFGGGPGLKGLGAHPPEGDRDHP